MDPLVAAVFGTIVGAASVLGNAPLDGIETRMRGLEQHKCGTHRPTAADPEEGGAQGPLQRHCPPPGPLDRVSLDVTRDKGNSIYPLPGGGEAAQQCGGRTKPRGVMREPPRHLQSGHHPCLT
ncbi:tricarboxylate transport protein A, mitochondrial-like [Pongo pygmaeus]|uniref:tricarboxylate transport protein A, mitochondrial-like n=1 Tax=Pongo pygmaeus TaxID=9600 RepID=UPI0023E20125|nr:tricarboxylate transport protein A, mitochondrial-like [Pongo pygmaeus]